jgi:hypothetical protein
VPTRQTILRRHRRRIQERDRRFFSLTAAERRLAIAREALEQEAAGVLAPSHGEGNGYLTPSDWRRRGDFYVGQAQDVADRVPVCHCCQLGAALLVSMQLFDRAPKGESLADLAGLPHRRVPYLREHFPSDQIEMLEIAFEQDALHSDGFATAEQRNAAMVFGLRYGDPRERFRAIWQNVIDNNGDFTP